MTTITVRSGDTIAVTASSTGCILKISGSAHIARMHMCASCSKPIAPTRKTCSDRCRTALYRSSRDKNSPSHVTRHRL
ncbi:DUF2116 family Zn-ribbon domain-containing protein [Bradyrhizobium elkanii]|uniref:DUF2116 family Zn-ribbon domain-containing protein n=1 Tax=Bradyrhizobium elkanii TaxID=29448 RepID=UPI00101E91D7|nr:DUF2116 family Zn-ribbon domain-containing protein [Bradyrhizobium elkanii]RYM19916.1 DUF2116 family Zn-ribbon domain-containing protein [Bradyrhizobium elkanii]UQD84767.1 DUF2116 family Zn-ribbon domain-containing protein [Bradyrhizobium elkanii USDA 76]